MAFTGLNEPAFAPGLPKQPDVISRPQRKDAQTTAFAAAVI
jgi:hypothetical protein